MAPSCSNHSEPVHLDTEAVFNRVYKMLEESVLEVNLDNQRGLHSNAEEVSNDPENDINLEDILSLEEDWLYYENNSNQEDVTDGSDGETVHEFNPGRCSSLEYDDIAESIPDEMIDSHNNYDSERNEPFDEYQSPNRRFEWVSGTGERYYACSNPIVERYECDLCNSNYVNDYIHQRFHQYADKLMNEPPNGVCGICNAKYTNEKVHLRFHAIATIYNLEN